jgi:hypothetical protein
MLERKVFCSVVILASAESMLSWPTADRETGKVAITTRMAAIVEIERFDEFIQGMSEQF